MIDKTRSRAGLTVLVALLAITAVAIPAFGALTVDTETTNTASTSEWTDGTTVTDITNSSKNATIQVDAGNATAADANEDFTLRLQNSETNQTFYETDDNWTQVSTTYFSYDVNYGEAFETLERDANDNVTVDVTVVWNESAADEESTTFQIYAENDETNAVIASTGEDDAATIEQTGAGVLNTITTLGGVVGNDSDNGSVGAARVSDTVGVNQTDTETVTVVMDNEDLQTSLGRVADQESGSLSLTGYAEIEDKTIPVFPQSADASWLDTESQTYATVNSAGDQVTVHNANDSLESSNVTVSVTSDELIGAGTSYSMLRDYGASFMTASRISLRAADLNGNPFDETTAGLGIGLLLLIGGPIGLRRWRAA